MSESLSERDFLSDDGETEHDGLTLSTEQPIGDYNLSQDDDFGSPDFEDDSKQGGFDTQRYFSESLGPTCRNCGKTGHLSRECEDDSKLPCFLCGQLGHNRSGCPEDVCYNCQQPGHLSKDCPQPKRRRFYGDSELCNRCGLAGHLQRDCSLSWRQYVFCKKLTKSLYNHSVSSISLSCYNCASDEHFGDECVERRFKTGNSIFHFPIYEYLELAAYQTNKSSSINAYGSHRAPHVPVSAASQTQFTNRPMYRGGYRKRGGKQ